MRVTGRAAMVPTIDRAVTAKPVPELPSEILRLTFPTVSLRKTAGVQAFGPATIVFPERAGAAMIVCHCQSISDKDIHAAIDWMRAADVDTVITPGKIYRALGKAADCGSCLPLFLSTMRQNDNLGVPMHLRGLRHAREQTQDTLHEGRRESY